MATGRLQDADKVYRHCLEIHEAHPGTDRRELADTLQRMTLLYMLMDRMYDAEGRCTTAVGRSAARSRRTMSRSRG